MAFAVEPYIFDWIFFDDSSLSKLGGFNHTKVGNKMSRWTVYPYYQHWLDVCDISPAWAFVLLIRVKGSQGLDKG